MSDSFFPGQLGATDYTCPENAHDFAIRMALAQVRTAGAVIVKAVYAGAQPDQYTVDVQLLVAMQDGAGNTLEHDVIFGRPVLNLSGANGSVCIQPAVGDKGLLLVLDRDHSSALKNKGLASPGSRRIHDLADSVYLGGFGAMNANSQRIVMTSSGIQIAGNVTITGTLSATGNITAGQGGADWVDMQNHVHAGVQSGGSSTSVPTAGT